jgi:hypothetical protein
VDDTVGAHNIRGGDSIAIHGCAAINGDGDVFALKSGQVASNEVGAQQGAGAINDVVGQCGTELCVGQCCQGGCCCCERAVVRCEHGEGTWAV